jgi:hypothetical protein
MTIEELKAQRRWVLWRLEPGDDGKLTKVPYQPRGYKASLLNPAHLHTYAELEPYAAKFSGIGLALGRFDGVYVWGVDFDKCCDAVSGRFTPEVRQVVIDLDTYSEYSPSGTGAHCLGVCQDDLPIEPGNKRSVLVRSYPGCKQIEIKGLGFYFTFTGRHLSKTPVDLMDRQEQLLALYQRVSKIAKPDRGKSSSITLTVPFTEEEKLKKLMAGDMSQYVDNHSSADFALCILLAKKHNCNAFKVDTEFRTSALYRDKWEREDYRETTITRAIAAVLRDTPVILTSTDTGDLMEDDGETQFLVESKEGPEHDGWFPKGELSLIGAPSGVGKTSWAMPLLENIRNGREVWGHPTKPRDYRVLLHDRSKKAMKRTARALHMGPEAIERIMRLTPEQQKQSPADILESAIAANPGVEIWFIEGLDLWIPDMNKMNVVAPMVDSIQRVATRRDVAIIATVGAPKQKGKDRYFGRDALFGSSALARKVETVVLMGLHDEEDPNSVRRVWVLPRAGKAEVMYFAWAAEGLVLTTEPEPIDKEETGAFGQITLAAHNFFQPGEAVTWRPEIGAEATFYRWKKWAIKKRLLIQVNGKTCLSTTGVKVVSA